MVDKIKLLVLSDDIRHTTGVGIQSNKILKGLQATGNFNITQLAGYPLSNQPTVVDGIEILPTRGYGNTQDFRKVFNARDFDIVLAFSDPRYFEWLFGIDDEIRVKSKLVLYHGWDNFPFPEYNRVWYSSCDSVITFSKFSHHLLTEGGVENTFIPHGLDIDEYFPLPEEIKESYREEFAKQSKLDYNKDLFLILWNNRNIHRKRPGDILELFKRYHTQNPNSALLLHTNPIDSGGVNIPYLVEQYLGDIPVILSSKPLSTDALNVYYNISNVSLNIAYNEGFGLGVGESLLAGTPVIATDTGGISEQLLTKDHILGKLLLPKISSLHGTVNQPFIYRDYVDIDDVVDSLHDIQKNPTAFNKQDLRQHIVDDYNIANTIKLFNEHLINLVKQESTYKLWGIVKC